ncbi:SagB/ThcOx family dehydrogenase [Synechococcus sp. Nb3U1]|uniref:SagB/ThcOx family dehydrogenase n=1 Tax=Synechococcus sp. Nb3U1 TaxID=1914529 RepID=UPI001F2957D9|nr:SagB/ThcOx family dehydrogenase [Synechococcus sp. Nb3U1]MCF2971818.1 SagB/ThcOx family dehydrogenase [Synechococcus sp. Nb3U1]
MSEPTACASLLYHEFTKYSPEGLARNTRQLDWSRQPQPYKDYPAGVGTMLDLRTHLQQGGPEPESQPPGEELSQLALWHRRRLSQLLYFSYGVTLVLPYANQPFYMRAAPSAGGLYPAELYLISQGVAGIPEGLYNYQVRSHSLVRFWDESRWQRLQAGCAEATILSQCSLALVVSAVFFRSAWRYEDRAYRRICLDSGHLLGNIELAANLTGYRAYLLGGFCDQIVEELLFLNPQQEGALVVIPLLDLWQPTPADEPQEMSQWPVSEFTALSSPTVTHVPELQDGDWLPFLHRVSRIESGSLARLLQPVASAEPPADKYNFPFCLRVSTATQPIDWGQHLQELVRSILKRRSTRHFTGEDLPLHRLLALLDFTYHPEHYTAQGLDGAPDYFDRSLVETFVVANGVEGLEPGCYYYAVQAQELRQIRFKNFRSEIFQLCLGQELGRDAAAIVFHTADLAKAVVRYGERAYRYLHLDAGHLGQRLNLAAIGLGLGVSGIAGFFDNQVNEVLGIPTSEAALYITTLGIPRSASAPDS